METSDSALSGIKDENDLILLCQFTGLCIEPRILRILIQLLHQNIQPTILHSVLHKISSRHASQRRSRTSHSGSQSSHPEGRSTRSMEKST